jgi:hypothetical protein
MTAFMHSIQTLNTFGVPYRVLINADNELVIRYNEYGEDYTDEVYAADGTLLQTVEVEVDTLASNIQWFYKDNGNMPPTSQIGTMEFLNEVADYLLTIVADCQRSIKQLGNPADLEGFDQILYDDHIELHNRAVDLYNDLIDRGVDCEV